MDYDLEEKEYNKDSVGHRLFEHYKESAIADYLEVLKEELKEKILRYGTECDLNERVINDIKFCNKVYNYLKREREKVIDTRDNEGLVEMTTHNMFMKYIEEFSIKDK